MNRKILFFLVIVILLVGSCSVAFIVINGNKNNKAQPDDVYDGYYMDLSNANSLALIDTKVGTSLSASNLSADASNIHVGDYVADKTLCKTLDGIHFEKVNVKEDSDKEDETIDPKWKIYSAYVVGGFMIITVASNYYSYDYGEEMYDKYGFCWDGILYYLVKMDTGKIFCINPLINSEYRNADGNLRLLSGHIEICRVVDNVMYYSLRGTDKDGAYSITVENDVLTSKLIMDGSGNIRVSDIYQNGVILYTMGEKQYLWLPQIKTAISYDSTINTSFNGYVAKNVVMDGYMPLSYEKLNADGTYTAVDMSDADVKSYFDNISGDTLIFKNTADDETTWVYTENKGTNSFYAVRIVLHNDGTITRDEIRSSIDEQYSFFPISSKRMKIENNQISYGDIKVTISSGYIEFKSVSSYVSGQSILRFSDSYIEYIDTKEWVSGELTAPEILQFSSLYMKNGKIIVEGKSVNMANVKGEIKSDLTLDLTYTEPEYTITTLFALN